MTTPVPTHFTPMLPLAWALRGAGHEALVLGQPDITAAAHTAGLSIACVGDYYDVTDLLAQSQGPMVKGAPRGSHPRPWVMHARYLTKAYLEFAEGFQSEGEQAEPTAAAAAAS